MVKYIVTFKMIYYHIVTAIPLKILCTLHSFTALNFLQNFAISPAIFPYFISLYTPECLCPKISWTSPNFNVISWILHSNYSDSMIIQQILHVGLMEVSITFVNSLHLPLMILLLTVHIWTRLRAVITLRAYDMKQLL